MSSVLTAVRGEDSRFTDAARGDVEAFRLTGVCRAEERVAVRAMAMTENLRGFTLPSWQGTKDGLRDSWGISVDRQHSRSDRDHGDPWPWPQHHEDHHDPSNETSRHNAYSEQKMAMVIHVRLFSEQGSQDSKRLHVEPF